MRVSRREQVPSLEWIYFPGYVDYLDALQTMESTIQAIRQGNASENILCLEHPPLYTAGTSAKDEHLLKTFNFPVHYTGRGGQFTYHGPGQLVAYVMLNLENRGRDIKAYVSALEQWIIEALSQFSIKAEQRPGRVGLWVTTNAGEEKIAAIGVRVTRWVTWHGLSINVNPNLEHFKGIVPCGLSEYGVTSLEKLGIGATVKEVQEALKSTCPF